MLRLENRFGARELPDTAQARFQQAAQSTDESLEDRADRMVTLSTRAFRELPETFANQQAVVRFCQGLLDKNVATQVSNKEPANMEDAINNVRWCQHVQQAVFGKKKERNRKSDDDSTFFCVPEMVSQTVPNTQRRVSSNPSEGSVESLIENLRQEMNRKLENVNAGFSTPNPRNVSAARVRGRGRGQAGLQ